MRWVEALFKGKAVWAKVDDGGQLVLDEGKASIRYQNDQGAKVYNPWPNNITLAGDAGAGGPPPEAAEPPLEQTEEPAQSPSTDFSRQTIDWAVPAGFQDAQRVFLQSSGRLEPDLSDHTPRWTHACISYNPTLVSDVVLTQEQKTVLYVAERILGRGYAPPVDPACRTEIAKVRDPEAVDSPSNTPDLSWESPDGSEEEVLFLELMMDTDFLPREWLPHLHLQVPFFSLLAQDSGQGRVDFAFYPPRDQGRAIVIEIDGHQHENPEQAQIDRERDQNLNLHGHRVLRFTAQQVRHREPAIGEEIRALLSERELPDRTDDAAVAAAQAARVAVDLVRLGMLPVDGGYWRVRTAGPQDEAVAAGLRMIQRLLRALGALYRTQIGPDSLELGSQVKDPHLILDWSSDPPWFGAVKTSEDGVPVVAVRPTYLPGWSRLPTQEWVPPDPTVETAHLTTLLRSVFPKNSEFWEGQEEGIRRILSGEDTLVLLPTGGGKSLVYQFSGLLMPGLTLVVSPLLALMNDQIDNLQRAGFERCAEISSRTTEAGQTHEIQRQLETGTYVLCYVSPERLQMEDFRDALRQVAGLMPVPSIIVDEAHCVSEWGHNFRTAYLNLGRIGRVIGRRGPGSTPAIIGLTGTASRAVLRDVQRDLGIQGIDAVITPETLDREELNFEVRWGPSNNKARMLNLAITCLPDRLDSTNARFWSDRGKDGLNSGIIFCPHIRGPYGVKRVAQDLMEGNALNVAVSDYSGNLTSTERTDRAREFKADEIRVLVATKSFGMGIDKRNVRFTIHYGFPQSLEALYQECGRAGRNRQKAHCVVIASVDNPDRAHELLDPGTEVTDVRNSVAGRPQSPDDVTRGLWFHTNAFKGTRHEVDQVDSVLIQLGDLSEGGTVDLSYRRANKKDTDEAKKNIEQALYRLLLLGVCEDFTVDYQNNRIKAYKTPASLEQIRENILNYVSAYSRGRATTIRDQLGELDSVGDIRDAILQGVEVVIEFIYSTIELGRRAALRATWDWCQKDPEQLRSELLLYLQETEFTQDVLALLEDDEFALDEWAVMVGRVSSSAHLKSLEATFARTAEDYPDHPMVLALRGVSMFALGKGQSPEAAQYLEAALGFVAGQYAGNVNPLRFRHWLLELFEWLERPDPNPMSVLRSLCRGDDGEFSRWLVGSDRPDEQRLVGLVRLMTIATEDLKGINKVLSPGRQHG